MNKAIMSVTTMIVSKKIRERERESISKIHRDEQGFFWVWYANDECVESNDDEFQKEEVDVIFSLLSMSFGNRHR